jgi:hypothetical protein
MKSRKNTHQSQMENISGPAESFGTSFAKVENEWVVLDRVVRRAALVAPFLKADKRCNASEVTLNLCLFQDECGFTREVSQNLFHQSNKARRRRCGDHGVTFVNAEQAYEKKKIVVKYKTLRSSFAALFGKQTAVMPTYTDASTGTDPPPVPAAPAVGVENAPPAHELQIVSVDKDKIVTRSRNNKMQEWHHIVAATEVNDDFERFRHALTAAHAEEILERLAGDIDVGVTLLVQLLYSISPDACKLGMKRCGAGVFHKLTPEQTLALTFGCGITAQARIYLNRFLTYFNNGYPLLACEADCADVKYKYVVKPEFATFKYKKDTGAPIPEDPGADDADLDADPEAENGTEVSVDYWQKDLLECVTSLLNSWRDESVPEGEVKTLGVKQGTFGVRIPVVIQGDYGGDLGKGETKILAVVIAREGGSYNTQIASLNGKEDHHVLKNTVMGPINSSVQKLNESKVLLLTWGNQCDFVIVPAAAEGPALTFFRFANSVTRVEWGTGHADFTRLDIPEDPAHRQHSFVSFLTTSGGDLKYQFALLGRANHCNSKCMQCRLMQAEWLAEPKVGFPFDMQQMQAQWHQIEQEHAAAHPNMTLPQYAETYVKQHGLKGRDGCDVLLPAIPVERYLLPPLHLMLGLGNNLVEMWMMFISTELDDGRERMLRAFLKLLAQYNIEHQKYYTKTYVGGDIRRFLDHSAEICAGALLIFKNAQYRRANVAVGIDARIDQFVGQMRNLMQVFWAINELMEQTSQLSPGDLDLFENLCSTFGRMWRVYFKDGMGAKKMSITPKLHQLESHLPDQMRLFGCIGDKAESAIERLHYLCNKSGRVLSAVKTWKEQKVIQLDRANKALVQLVVEAGNEVMLGTKRKFSPETMARKMAKSTTKVETRRERLTSAANCAAGFAIAHAIA